MASVEMEGSYPKEASLASTDLNTQYLRVTNSTTLLLLPHSINAMTVRALRTIDHKLARFGMDQL